MIEHGSGVAWGRHRTRAASIGMVAVMLLLAAFAILSAVASDRLARSTAEALRLSDSFEQARFALLGEGAIAQTYIIEPSPQVRSMHRQAVDGMNSALAEMQRLGGPRHETLVGRLRGQQAEYLWAIDKMFDAVDNANDAELVRNLNDTLVTPSYQRMQATIASASDEHRQAGLDGLRRLRTVESVIAWTTPPAFAAGLLFLWGYARLVIRYQRELDARANRDTLTGLPNRERFTVEVAEAVARAEVTGVPLAVMLLDLDRFKEINDTLGHSTGDRLLTQVGPRLRAVLRKGDIVARFGGDEFGVLTTDLSEETALQVADRLVTALQEPFAIDGLSISAEASIGIANHPRDGRLAEELIQRADAAMYVAKADRLGTSEYDADRDDHSTGRLSLLGELRSALARDELVLHYQPLVGMSDRRLHAVEALVRWRHPTRGLVFPDEFIPIAESSGLIHDLTRHVLDLACGQVARWNQDGKDVRVAVNISARCLLDITLPDTAAAALASAGVPADRLLLEITESAIMVDPSRALEVLTRMRALGVELSIDDFGTGYTSMAYLRDLPVRELKIDRTFVQGMVTEQRDASIVETMIDFAHRLGMTAVAEGIEDEATWSALLALGCDFAQGYHIGMPMPAVQLTEWLTRWQALHPRLHLPS